MTRLPVRWALSVAVLGALASGPLLAQVPAAATTPPVAPSTAPAAPSAVPPPGDAYWSNRTAALPSVTSTNPSSPAMGAAGEVPGDAYWTNRAMPTAGGMVSGPTSAKDVLSDAVWDAQAKASDISPVRVAQIQGAAAAYGAQAGMAAKAREINATLQARAQRYDRAFNFGALMLEPGFLPPVISEGRDAYRQPTDHEVRAADRIYRIEFPARLVNVAPTWRNYLPVPETTPMAPDPSVLPADRDEKNVWDQWAVEGWKQGEALAKATLEDNVGRLKRDFEGMVRFKALYEQGVVSKPLLARSTLGVTGGGDEMAVNDRIYRITEKAQLNAAPQRWQAPVPVTGGQDVPRVPAPEPQPR